MLHPVKRNRRKKSEYFRKDAQLSLFGYHGSFPHPSETHLSRLAHTMRKANSEDLTVLRTKLTKMGATLGGLVSLDGPVYSFVGPSGVSCGSTQGGSVSPDAPVQDHPAMTYKQFLDLYSDNFHGDHSHNPRTLRLVSPHLWPKVPDTLLRNSDVLNLTDACPTYTTALQSSYSDYSDSELGYDHKHAPYKIKTEKLSVPTGVIKRLSASFEALVEAVPDDHLLFFRLKDAKKSEEDLPDIKRQKELLVRYVRYVLNRNFRNQPHFLSTHVRYGNNYVNRRFIQSSFHRVLEAPLPDETYEQLIQSGKLVHYGAFYSERDPRNRGPMFPNADRKDAWRIFKQSNNVPRVRRGKLTVTDAPTYKHDEETFEKLYEFGFEVTEEEFLYNGAHDVYLRYYEGMVKSFTVDGFEPKYYLNHLRFDGPDPRMVAEVGTRLQMSGNHLHGLHHYYRGAIYDMGTDGKVSRGSTLALSAHTLNPMPRIMNGPNAHLFSIDAAQSFYLRHLKDMEDAEAHENDSSEYMMPYPFSWMLAPIPPKYNKMYGTIMGNDNPNYLFRQLHKNAEAGKTNLYEGITPFVLPADINQRHIGLGVPNEDTYLSPDWSHNHAGLFRRLTTITEFHPWLIEYCFWADELATYYALELSPYHALRG